VTAKRIGYASLTQKVTVTEGGTATADFSMDKQAAKLDVVISSVTGDVQKKEVANAVAILASDSLMANAPINTLDQMLAARIPGVMVVFANGYSGMSTRSASEGSAVWLGIATDHLHRWDPGGRQLWWRGRDGGESDPVTATSMHRGSRRVGSTTTTSGFESVEVVKGPAATTLYGVEAANGVIVIRTKRGQAGRTNWTAFAEHGGLGIPVSMLRGTTWPGVTVDRHLAYRNVTSTSSTT